MKFKNDTAHIKKNTQVELGFYLVLYVAPQVGKGIRDSNKSKKKLGKMVVLPNGISIKHGKYESSHLSRRKLDFLHLRYEDAKEKGQNIFPDVFIKSYNC